MNDTKPLVTAKVLAEVARVILEQLDDLTAEFITASAGDDERVTRYNEMSLVRDAYKPALEAIIRRGR